MRILYVLGTFPKLSSEACILQEIVEIIRGNHKVFLAPSLFSEPSSSESVHQEYSSYDLPSRVLGAQPHSRGRDLFLPFLRTFLSFLFRSPLRALHTLFSSFLLSREQKRDFPWAYFRSYILLSDVILKDIDVIHVPFSDISLVKRADILSRLLHIPFTISFRARELHDAQYRQEISLQRELFLRASALITISSFNIPFLRHLFGERSYPVVHSMISAEKFSPPKKRSSSPRLLTVCRFVEKKGIPYLIEALSLLYKRGVTFHWTLVGEGPLLASYRQQIEAAGIAHLVTILPPMPQEKLVSYFSSHSIFVLPCVVAQNGDRDILPNVLKEAMAMELPVLTSNISGIDELIAHGQTGYLVPEKDSALLAQGLETLLSDPSLCQLLGKEGRKKVLSDFSSRHEIRHLFDVFLSVVPGGSVDPFLKIKVFCEGLMDVSIYRELAVVAMQAPPGNFIEVGAAQGAASISLAQGILSAKKPTTLYAFEKGEGGTRDLWGSREENLSLLQSNLSFFGVDSLVQVIPLRIHEGKDHVLSHGPFSLLLLDADGWIDRDLSLFYNLLVPGSWIIIDDYSPERDFRSESTTCRYGKQYTTYVLTNYFLEQGFLQKEKRIGSTLFCRKPLHLTREVSFSQEDLLRLRQHLRVPSHS